MLAGYGGPDWLCHRCQPRIFLYRNCCFAEIMYISSISIMSLVSTWRHSKEDPTDCFTDAKQRFGFISDNVFEFVFVFVYLC